MRLFWSTSALAIAIALVSPLAHGSIQKNTDQRGFKVSGALEPLRDSMGAKKQPVKARNTPTRKPTAKTNQKTNSGKPQQPPSPDVRRRTAGPGASEVPEPDPAEVRALKQAEQELFGPDDGGESAAPPELLPGATGAEVHASGLPPPPASPRPEITPPRLDFLASLRMPDVPVKWSTRILQYLDFYKNDPRGRTIITIWYRRSGRYEPMLRGVLRQHGVPEDLMWVAVVESGLRPTVYSPAGAAGLWQFMPQTGRLYGLVVDRWVDERLDPVRSTHAAAMYLHDLHKRFGTWELALGSYNMGFGGMLTAMRKYNTNDFWELSRYEAGIPWETTLYVPKILALAVVAKNPDIFGLTNVTRDPPAEFDEVDIVPGVSIEAVAKAAEVDVSDIEQLNPQLLASRVPPRAPSRSAAGLWTLRVPKGHAAKVDENLVKTRAKEPPLVSYTVRHGESLADIASACGMTTAELSRHNALRSDETLRPGSILMIRPGNPKSMDAENLVIVVPVDLRPPDGHERRFYQAVAGDTLEGVASALSVNPDDLRRWNGLDPRARLQSGMFLMALVPKAQRLSHVRTFTEEEVRVLVVGSDAFFDHHEGQRGRVRMVTVVRPGETWRTISQRTGLSLGMLERINRRSRSEALQSGERLVVYVPASKVGSQPKVSQPKVSQPKVAETVSEIAEAVAETGETDGEGRATAEPEASSGPEEPSMPES